MERNASPAEVAKECERLICRLLAPEDRDRWRLYTVSKIKEQLALSQAVDAIESCLGLNAQGRASEAQSLFRETFGNGK